MLGKTVKRSVLRSSCSPSSSGPGAAAAAEQTWQRECWPAAAESCCWQCLACFLPAAGGGRRAVGGAGRRRAAGACGRGSRVSARAAAMRPHLRRRSGPGGPRCRTRQETGPGGAPGRATGSPRPAAAPGEASGGARRAGECGAPGPRARRRSHLLLQRGRGKRHCWGQCARGMAARAALVRAQGQQPTAGRTGAARGRLLPGRRAAYYWCLCRERWVCQAPARCKTRAGAFGGRVRGSLEPRSAQAFTKVLCHQAATATDRRSEQRPSLVSRCTRR
jgi:hypothetical protein